MKAPLSKGEKTSATIRATAVRLMYEHGYEGMSLRLLARESGLKVGSLYNHITTKEQFVADIMCDTMRQLTTNLNDVLLSEDDSITEIKLYIKVMVEWFTEKKAESMIALSETRILPKSHIQEFYQLRRQFETVIYDVVAKGLARGVFALNDSKVASVAIFNMLIGICVWYKTDGRLSPAQINEEYTALILNMLGAPTAENN